MKKQIPLLTLALLFLALLPALSFAADRYVSTTGSNTTGNGTAGNPWRTIQFAINNSLAGDVIHLAEGTYVESNILVNKTLTIVGEVANRNLVVVAPAAEDGNADNAFGNNAQNGFVIKAHGITISNLTLNGRGNVALTPGKNNYRAAIVSLDPSQADGGSWNNLHLNNLLVKYTYRRGISVFPRTVSGTLIEHCQVEHVAFNHGIYMAGQGQVLNNIVTDCFQGIVVNPDQTTPPGPIRISFNTLDGIMNIPGCWGDLGGGTYTGQPRAIQYDNASGAPLTVEISNNAIVSNDYGTDVVGIYLRRASENSVVENNAITLLNGNFGKGILAGWTYDNGYTIRNNDIIVSGTGSAIYVFGSGTAAKPLVLENNTLVGVNSFYTGPGDGTGVVLTNRYLDGADLHPSFVIMRQNNAVSGFKRGIDVINLVLTNPKPALTLQVTANTAPITSNEYGLYANFGTISITGSSLSGNTNMGIFLSGTATGSFIGNTIENNTNWGLNNVTGVSVDATNCWWGSCYGPFHATLNPAGTGNPVSNNVVFIPFVSGVNIYAMNGGGPTCEGSPGVPVGLTGSQAGVNYQLYLDGSPIGALIPGTGAPLTFGLQSQSGTYTAHGINPGTGCDLPMNGSALVTVIPLPFKPGVIVGPAIVQQGQTGVTYYITLLPNTTSYTWNLPPGAVITNGIGSNLIKVNFGAGALSGNMSVAGINACGIGPLSDNKYITVIATSTNVNNVVVHSGETKCYDAVQVINVAGGGTTFLVENGGSATFIAGQKIYFLPGTMVQAGGYLIGRITTTGNFCSGVLPPGKNGEEGGGDPLAETAWQEHLFRVYPNPTNGKFTLALNPDVEPQPMTVVIYDMTGNIVFRKDFPALEGDREFSLADRGTGIYLVRVRMADRVETAKVIKVR